MISMMGLALLAVLGIFVGSPLQPTILAASGLIAARAYWLTGRRSRIIDAAIMLHFMWLVSIFPAYAEELSGWAPIFTSLSWAFVVAAALSVIVSFLSVRVWGRKNALD